MLLNLISCWDATDKIIRAKRCESLSCRCTPEGGVFHGSDWRADAVRHQEESCSRCQGCQTRGERPAFFKGIGWHMRSLHLVAFILHSVISNRLCLCVCLCRQEQKSQQFIQSSTLNVSGSLSLRSLPSSVIQISSFNTRGVSLCNTGVISNQHQEALNMHCWFINDLLVFFVAFTLFIILYCKMDCAFNCNEELDFTHWTKSLLGNLLSLLGFLFFSLKVLAILHPRTQWEVEMMRKTYFLNTLIVAAWEKDVCFPLKY